MERERKQEYGYRACVCLGSVDVEKPLSLFFCFLESANNVSENQTPVQPETKSERSVLIEIEEEPFSLRPEKHKSKMFFPAIFEPHFQFSLGASSLKIFKIIATYY